MRKETENKLNSIVNKNIPYALLRPTFTVTFDIGDGTTEELIDTTMERTPDDLDISRIKSIHIDGKQIPGHRFTEIINNETELRKTKQQIMEILEESRELDDLIEHEANRDKMTWRRKNGQKVAFSDMNIRHLKNAIYLLRSTTNRLLNNVLKHYDLITELRYRELIHKENSTSKEEMSLGLDCE